MSPTASVYPYAGPGDTISDLLNKTPEEAIAFHREGWEEYVAESKATGESYKTWKETLYTYLESEKAEAQKHEVAAIALIRAIDALEDRDE